MSTTNVRGKLRGNTLYTLGKSIQVAKDGRVNSNSPSIVDGIKPRKRILDEGLHILNPDELAAILIPTQEVSGGKIHGFQRPIIRPHIRKIAAHFLAGGTVDPPTVSIYSNALWGVDGQQRMLGAIMARVPLKINVEKLDAEQMRQRYAQQKNQKKINPSNLVLSDTNDFALYVQEAAVGTKGNPWSDITGSNSSSEKKLSPKQVYDAVRKYVGNAVHESVNESNVTFNRDYSDELATLVNAFGNKQTNPLAFKPLSIRAITYAAVVIIRRNGSQQKDIDRWVKHMSTFNFAEWQGIRRSNELATFLIRHWNKKLQAANRVRLPDEMA